jgi:hypothetical protein
VKAVVRHIVNVFQIVSMLPSIPFVVVRWLAMGIYRLARTGEIFMIRNLYYPVTVVRRRLYGEPLWKPMDLSIGIAPPEGYEPPVCPDCGMAHAPAGGAHPVPAPEFAICSLCESKISLDISAPPPGWACRKCIDEINADPHEEVSP